jgi:hypothetical protein
MATAAELVATADQRMYLAKQAGRNCYVDSATGVPQPQPGTMDEKLAEGVRFELTNGLPRCRFSRPVP